VTTFDAAGFQTEQLQRCGPTASVVYAGLKPYAHVAGGGGVLAYTKVDGGVWRVPASSQTSVQILPGVDPWFLSVDSRYVAYTLVIDPSPPGSFRLRSFDAQNATDRSVDVGLVEGHIPCGGRLFYWASSDGGHTWALFSVPEDGSGSPATMTTQTTASGVTCDGSDIAWVNDQGAIVTTPVAGGPLMTHATVPQQTTYAIASDGVYFVHYGMPGSDGFMPFTIEREPFDGGTATTLASSLPENFPAGTGTYHNTTSELVRGPHHLFWAECWGGVGNGGGHYNWVVRRLDPSSGASPDVIETFSWTPSSATSGVCPQLLGDGTALYYTREGTLMRLCD
jgi:hypothetical protein